jgi:mannosyltransferase OCH1-like enzyme
MWGLWDSSDIPSRYLKNQEKNQEILKGSNKITHGKKDIEDLVLKYSHEFDPEFSSIYNSIKRNVTKADIGRYLLIYYYGGVYLDNDVDIKTAFSMSDLKTYKNGVWYTEAIVDVKDLDSREEKIPNRYANYIIASLYPRNQILLDIIKESSKRIKTLKDSVNWTDNDVLWSAGPDVVTSILTHTKHNNFIIYDKQKSDKILIHKRESSWRREKDK